MKFSTAIATLLALVAPTHAELVERKVAGHELTPREKAKAAAGEGIGKDWVIKVTNGAYQQPFGGFFIMVHSQSAERLFSVGDEFVFGNPDGSEAPGIAILAENGSPARLVEEFQDKDGVLYAEGFGIGENGPLFGGETGEIKIFTKGVHKYVTIASMIINTNDGFVAMNGVEVRPGLSFSGPVYDAGTEVNNENCDSVPGPACPMDSGNIHTVSPDPEGFVHVHRGFFGIGANSGSDPVLSEQGYDWRNPVLFTTIMQDKDP